MILINKDVEKDIREPKVIARLKKAGWQEKSEKAEPKKKSEKAE